MKEEYLLTGPLEATNRPYAIAKIAGVEMCWSYNRQYGTQYLAAMPTNLYGPGDNYHPENSHVIPALIRKFHEAKVIDNPIVTVWGTGTPRREFLYSDDMADACVYLMNLPEINLQVCSVVTKQDRLFRAAARKRWRGRGHHHSRFSYNDSQIIGFKGELVFDTSKPDGTPRKLMDTTRLNSMGWRARTPLAEGLAIAYREFVDTFISAH